MEFSHGDGKTLTESLVLGTQIVLSKCKEHELRYQLDSKFVNYFYTFRIIHLFLNHVMPQILISGF